MMTQTTTGTTSSGEDVAQLAAEVAELESAAQQRDFARRLALHRGDASALVTLDAEQEIGAARLAAARDKLAATKTEARYAAWLERDQALRQELSDFRETRLGQLAEAERLEHLARAARKAFDLGRGRVEELESCIARHSQERPPLPARPFTLRRG